MTRFKKLLTVSSLFAAVAGVALSTPAFAGVSVSSPYNGEQVGTKFTLSANISSCSNQTVSAMGYSFDSSSNTTIVHANAINAQVQSGTGTHTLHVKAWGNRGASCVTDVVIHVAGTGAPSSSAPAASSPGSSAPAVYVPGGHSVSSIQALGAWKQQHDSGTKGWSSGSTGMTSSPSRSGNARRFVASYSGSGGELFHVSFADDTAATNLAYDGWVYIPSSSSAFMNLEMDMNQVMSNGQTVIYGFQCDGWSGTWDYTENKGTPQHPVDAWVHSHAPCNPRSWSRNTWHHVQISYSRNNSGVVTYHSVSLDGKTYGINATVPSSFALGWGPTLLTNFQIDGSGSGTATVYLDDLTVSRW